jgi:rsbT co-antagonist protein RsbR
MSPDRGALAPLVAQSRDRILEDWVGLQLNAPSRRVDLIKEEALREQSRQFLEAVARALDAGGDDAGGPEWGDARSILGDVSRARARMGFSPSETAVFVLSLKQAFFNALQKELATDASVLASEIWRANLLLDSLSLWTMEEYQKGREQVIRRQQEELLELSTPVVQLWENILALPLIGTLDSARTQVVMESLLQSVVDTGATIAIIDITGVPTVDTVVAQHLLKTVAAARLMGADCIISGIRPQIAQTIVHLGVNLGEVTTKASLADAFAVALRRNGLQVCARPQAS